MIDAHAGGIGGLALTINYLTKSPQSLSNIGECFKGSSEISSEDVLVLVSGTSSCFMASSQKANFISGIWGPYYSAMVPGLFLNEAGQSACGKLIEHVIESHPAYSELKGTDVFAKLDAVLNELCRVEGLEKSCLSRLTKDIHIYPDFHGNRSPFADPCMKGIY